MSSVYWTFSNKGIILFSLNAQTHSPCIILFMFPSFPSSASQDLHRILPFFLPNKPPIMRLQVLGKNKNKNFDCHISVDCNQEEGKKKKSL